MVVISWNLTEFYVLVFSIVAISFDYYFAVCKKLSYDSRSTKNTKIIIISNWIIALVLGFLPFIGRNICIIISNQCDSQKLIYYYTGILTLSTLIIFILYSLIFIENRHRVSF
jgi:hypothetical protein